MNPLNLSYHNHLQVTGCSPVCAGPNGRGNSSTSPDSCADWEGNNSTLGFGGDLASEAAAINASEGQLDPITSFPSGGILPSLRFSVLDHFGNLVSGVYSPQQTYPTLLPAPPHAMS